MALDKVVVERLSERAGYPVDTPRGCENLHLDIQTALNLEAHECPSVNTLKRITGVLAYKGNPRRSTLDILARYIGYKNWPAMYNDITDYRCSGFNRPVTCYDMKELPTDTKVGIKWSPDRSLNLRHIGKGEYVVEKIRNGSLRVGDHVWLSQLVLRFPFFAKKVVRNNNNLGTYVSAQEWGIEQIRMRRPKETVPAT